MAKQPKARHFGIKRKHTSGAAKNFITRTQAVKKLQVSLADFRRLCIFKGIYPREPRNKKKANKGSTAPTTFYYTKDIQYLLHEPVLQKFRDHKAFAKKLNKALGKGEVHQAKRLDENRPQYTLDHVIKERYPSFVDALRDLDDALNMLFLFSLLPATDKISHKITAEADKLCNQWMAYVARQKLLTKVFVSIKGVYYEAVVRGQKVMWLVPFKFTQNIPSDIDFRIMCTFLEFYCVLLKFTTYKLYTDSDLIYPPKISAQKIKGVGGITAYVLESTSERPLNGAEKLTASKNAQESNVDLALDKASKADAEHEADEVDVEEDEETGELDTFTAAPATATGASDVLAQPTEHANEIGNLFSEFTFFIGREVPLDIVEFLITACSGKFISEAANDELIDNEDENASNDAASAAAKVDVSGVTHQICDRPSITSKVPGRVYVQPQWVFDSINRGKLQAVNEYAPGETLPPHLSPWGDAGTYDPEADVQDGEDDESGSDSDEEEVIEGGPDEEDEEDEEMQERQRELEQEAAGVKASAAPKADKKQQKKKRGLTQEEEDKELRKSMMSNKTKKLYNKMQYGINKDEERTEHLKKKRRKNDKTGKK